jgi:hypothetical protein
VPNFAAYIVAKNLAGAKPAINFKGFAVGNAWTVPAADNTGAVLHWYTRAMIR